MYPEQVNNNYEVDSILLYGLQQTSFYKETKENKVMKQLIDKSAVMAEIERKKIPSKKDIDDGVYPTYLCALMDFEDFLDTLDVKEVDLEQEIKDILNQYYYFPEEAIDIPTIIRITAHHFFELGLETQKGE